MLAILLQNAQQAKNASRVDAIKNGDYKEITTKQQANDYLKDLLSNLFEIELHKNESEIRTKAAKENSSQSVILTTQAPDEYIAGAVLTKEVFYNGKGDRGAFIKQILATEDPSEIVDLAEKLRMVATGEYHGQTVFNDNWKAKDTQVGKSKVFKLWLHLCRKHDCISLGRMVEMFPYFAVKLNLWDKCCGADGKINMNSVAYAEYMKKRNIVNENIKKMKLADKQAKKVKVKK